MFHIVSDSGCDWSQDQAKALGVDVVPFYLTFDEQTFLKEGICISNADYFARLQEDKTVFPKTSQPSPQDFIEVYQPQLEAGKDIIVVTISSKTSGTFNSANLAAEMLASDYPERSIFVIDSMTGSVGEALIIKELIKMRDKGYDAQRASQLAEAVKETTKTYFTLDTLDYLKRGGRVGSTTALVGGVLGLRPVLHMVDGSIEQLESVRGRKKVLKMLEEGIEAALKEEAQDVELSVGHILCAEEAAQLKANFEKALAVEFDHDITPVGAAIGTHTGPGALAVAYCIRHEALEARMSGNGLPAVSAAA
ncbi:MAG: DegV family protein [Coriobacteriia bacterium]|nr:DegV family protein [Coriobacteriia bacterium]MCL2537725.1 DegV family protein [Coriobacteriia bacterium]